MKTTILSFKAAGLALLFASVGTVLAASENDLSKSSTATKPQTLWNAAALKTPLKRETLPIPSSKLTGGKSAEIFHTASQTLLGHNGVQGGNGGAGYYNGGFNGFGGQLGFSPNYVNGGGVGNRVGTNGYNQYSQLGNAYNVLDQNQGSLFGQNPYYSNNYFGGGNQGGFNAYPYAQQGGIGGGGSYPFASPQQGFGFGGFGNQGFGNQGFGGQGFYPGAQYQPGQIGSRNFGFVNQGFGNPAFSGPQGGAVSSSPGNFNSVPSTVQVGTGLEVGNRGFSGGAGNAGGFPSASGQQYIVGNGIGQPAFIGSAAPQGGFGFGGPFGGAGAYSPGIPGGVYRQQNPNSLFGPYDYPRPLSATSSPSTNTSRPNSPANRLQTTGPNRYYQGVGPTGTRTPGSRERIYRFTTSNES